MRAPTDDEPTDADRIRELRAALRAAREICDQERRARAAAEESAARAWRLAFPDARTRQP